MKKKLNSSSKRKWVLNGVLLFGGIALLTTGFATWIVGVDQKSDDSTVGKVTVDTSENKSVTLTLDFDETAYNALPGNESSSYTKKMNTIVLEEPNTALNQPNVNIKDKTTVPSKEAPLTLNVAKGALKIEYGTKLLAGSEKIKGINYSLKTKAVAEESIGSNVKTYTQLDEVSELTTDNKRTAADKTITDATGIENGQYWSYIDAPVATAFHTQLDASTSISGDDWKVVVTGDLITVTNEKPFLVPFTWGSYFNKETPATYYNKITATTPDLNPQLWNAIDAELNAMHTALDNQDLVLTATLDIGA